MKRLIFSGRMPERHLMLDIETLDTNITAAIVAVGAVCFDPRSDKLLKQHEFHCTISRYSNEKWGRTESKATLLWWAQQSEEAKRAVFGGHPLGLSQGLSEFTRWVNCLRPKCTRVWAKSPDFDCKIMQDACSELRIMWPFKFWESRCVRTIMDLAYPEGDFPHINVDGPKHDALSDARLQAKQVQHAYYVLGA